MCRDVSLIGRQLEESRGLAIILRQTVETAVVTNAEIVLRCGISLIGGKLEKAGGFALIPHDPAKSQLVTAREMYFAWGSPRSAASLMNCTASLSPSGIWPRPRELPTMRHSSFERVDVRQRLCRCDEAPVFGPLAPAAQPSQHHRFA
ncbi:MAG TPA: hypothetical protein VJY34_07020 [Roseiarcus sp.]|nr:hypothetical protein [Roseiarcus sp.]